MILRNPQFLVFLALIPALALAWRLRRGRVSGVALAPTITVQQNSTLGGVLTGPLTPDSCDTAFPTAGSVTSTLVRLARSHQSSMPAPRTVRASVPFRSKTLIATAGTGASPARRVMTSVRAGIRAVASSTGYRSGFPAGSGRVPA